MEKKDKLGLEFYWKFHKLLKRLQPVLIHSYLNTPNFYARAAKIFGGVKRVITSERNTSLTRVDFMLEKLMWRISDRIIVNAEKTVDRLTKDIGVTPDKIVFIPNGIDIDAFSNPNIDKIGNIRKQLSLNAGELLIGVFRPDL